MTRLKHVIVEIFCCEENEPEYNCLKCNQVRFTYAPNEIALSNDIGVVEDMTSWIGLGGDMIPDNIDDVKYNELKNIWEKVCRKKIAEAYEEYMKITEGRTNVMKKNDDES